MARFLFRRTLADMFHRDTSIPNLKGDLAYGCRAHDAYRYLPDAPALQPHETSSHDQNKRVDGSKCATYVFLRVSLRNSISAREIRYNWVETRPCRWNSFDHVGDFAKMIKYCSGLTRVWKIRENKEKKIIFLNIEFTNLESLFNNN